MRTNNTNKLVIEYLRITGDYNNLKESDGTYIFNIEDIRYFNIDKDEILIYLYRSSFRFYYDIDTRYRGCSTSYRESCTNENFVILKDINKTLEAIENIDNINLSKFKRDE